MSSLKTSKEGDLPPWLLKKREIAREPYFATFSVNCDIFLKFSQKYNIVIHFNELVNYYILLLFMLLFIISENKIFDYTLAAALAEANSSLSWYNWLAMLIKFSQLIVSYAKSESSEFPLTKTNFVQQWVWCIHDRLFRKANSYSFHGLAQNIKQLSNYNEQTRSNVNKPLHTNSDNPRNVLNRKNGKDNSYF